MVCGLRLQADALSRKHSRPAFAGLLIYIPFAIFFQKQFDAVKFVTRGKYPASLNAGQPSCLSNSM
jgi:hypothetical protein